MKLRNLLLVLVMAVAPLTGCNALLGPQRAAATAETAQERLELRGYAIERSWNILLEDALVIASAPTTTQSVQTAVQRASAAGTSVVDQMSDQLAAFAVERAKFEAGQSTVEVMTIVTNNLQDWVNRAEGALLNLRSALNP